MVTWLRWNKTLDVCQGTSLRFFEHPLNRFEQCSRTKKETKMPFGRAWCCLPLRLWCLWQLKAQVYYLFLSFIRFEQFCSKFGQFSIPVMLSQMLKNISPSFGEILKNQPHSSKFLPLLGQKCWQTMGFVSGSPS